MRRHICERWRVIDERTHGKAAADPGPGPLIIESDDLRKDYEVLKSEGVQFVEPDVTHPDR